MNFENKVFPNDEQLQGFNDDPNLGPIKMLNLLKLKKKAEYADGRETNLSGLEAYMLYGEEVQHHLDPLFFQNLTIRFNKLKVLSFYVKCEIN